MSKKSLIAAAVGTAFAATLAAPVVSAAGNPFALSALASGYQVADNTPTKPMEGKCGGAAKPAEGKCGAAAKPAEGKCGASKDAKMKDGKCGATKKTTQARPKPEKPALKIKGGEYGGATRPDSQCGAADKQGVVCTGPACVGHNFDYR